MATRLMSKWTFDGEEYEIKDANARSRLTTVENKMVTSVDGKGLSTNDFTNEYKNKVDTTSTDLSSHVSNKSNPHSVTASQVGLGNVTNNKQVKGLSSGTTAGHVVTWGADGYSVQDSGFTLKKSVPADAVFTDTVYTHPTVTAGETTPTGTLTHGGTFSALSAITVNNNGHVTGYATKTFTLPSETSLSLETSGTGNVITGVSVSGHKVTVTKGNVATTDHTHSNYVNQNAFSNVVVGGTTVAADTVTDTLTLVAGSNVTLTPDATNDKITISATNTTYTHPTYTAKSSGFYKVAVDGTGHVSGTTAVTQSDIAALGIAKSSDIRKFYLTDSIDNMNIIQYGDVAFLIV